MAKNTSILLGEYFEKYVNEKNCFVISMNLKDNFSKTVYTNKAADAVYADSAADYSKPLESFCVCGYSETKHAFKVAGFYSVSEYFADWDFWWIQNYKGNPDLKPESSVTVDFGLGFTSKNEAFNIDITFFNTNHTDKIVEYKENDTTFFKNANSALYQGFETMASVDFGKFLSDRYKLELYANLTIMTNCTFEDTKVEGGNTVKFDRDMLYIRKSNGSFGVMFDNYKGFSTRLNARYIGSRLEKDNFASLRPKITAVDYYQKGGYTAADKVLQHPDYLIFDYSVSYTFQKNKKFGLTIANLLDENYTEKDGYNMPGRSVMGSFTYNF